MRKRKTKHQYAFESVSLCVGAGCGERRRSAAAGIFIISESVPDAGRRVRGDSQLFVPAKMASAEAWRGERERLQFAVNIFVCLHNAFA